MLLWWEGWLVGRFFFGFEGGFIIFVCCGWGIVLWFFGYVNLGIVGVIGFSIGGVIYFIGVGFIGVEVMFGCVSFVWVVEVWGKVSFEEWWYNLWVWEKVLEGDLIWWGKLWVIGFGVFLIEFGESFWEVWWFLVGLVWNLGDFKFLGLLFEIVMGFGFGIFGVVNVFGLIFDFLFCILWE